MEKFGLKNISKLLLSSRIGIIRATIIVLGLFAMSVVWPMGKFKTTYKSTATWDEVRFIGPGTEDSVIRQEFSPNYEKIDSMSVYIVNEADSFDTLETFLRIYSLSGDVLYESKVNLADFNVPGMVEFPINATLDPQTVYFYTVGGTDGEVFVALCSDEVGNAEDGAFYFNNVHSGGTNVVAEFNYIRPWGTKRIIVTDVTIALLTLLAYAAVSILLSKKDAESIKKAEKVFGYVLSGLLIAFGIVAVVGIAGFELFEHDALNNTVLCIGTAVTIALAVYFILTARTATEVVDTEERIKALGRVVGTLLLAGAVTMCCLYLNSASDFEHGLWIRRTLVFLGLYLYSLGTYRQIWNIPSAVWSVLSVGIGKYYIRLHSDHPEHISTATSTAWLMWVVGLLVIGLIYRIKDKDYKNLRNIKLSFAVPTIIFWILCLVFANGRAWPAEQLVAFAVTYLFFYMRKDREHLLEMVCNAWLLSFFAGLIFDLYRRPYQYYRMTRYGGIFFTVTVTSTFYLIAGAAALVKLLIAYRQGDFKDKLIAYVSFGTVCAYMLFTASRTGLLALAAEVLFTLIIYLWHAKKKLIRTNVIKPIAGTLLAVIVSFFTCFSLTRMVPAVVANPYYFPHESFCMYLNEDTPWDGGDNSTERFANIQLSLNMVFGRLFEFGDDDDIFKKSADILGIPTINRVQAAETNPADDESYVEEYSNGRMDIFRAYIRNWNLTGHDTMGVEDENGEILVHAHNSFLQVAHDFGLIVGGLFVLLCLYAFFRSIVYSVVNSERKPYAPLLLLTIVAFGSASMFEWIYHPFNPLGFVFTLTLVLLSEKDSVLDAKEDSRS